MIVHLRDALTRADLAGVVVSAEPGGLTVTTNLSGRATFADLPIGLYRFSASPRAIRLSGTTFISGGPVSVSTNWTSFAAGSTKNVALDARRFTEDDFNFVTLHKAGTPLFVQANCVACHSDRKNELSAVATLPPFHAMGGPVGHSTLQCTFCHATVDYHEESGAALRKQVTINRCRTCHTGYPNAF